MGSHMMTTIRSNMTMRYRSSDYGAAAELNIFTFEEVIILDDDTSKVIDVMNIENEELLSHILESYYKTIKLCRGLYPWYPKYL